MEEEIRELIGRHLLDDTGRKLLAEISDSDSLLELGLLDSLGVVQLIALVEERFDIVFDPLDITLENVESIEKLVKLIRTKMRSGKD